MATRRTRSLTGFFLTPLSIGLLLLSACGGGGSDNLPPTPPTGTPAPSGLSYPTPQVFTTGQAVAIVSPTVTGTVTSYSVSPALPAGLVLSAASGTISGTPTAVTLQAKYTVTASNSGGAATADIMIAVNDVKPAAISYPSPAVALATGLPTTKLAPSTTAGGGAVTGWSVSPALPAGLSFSTTDGTISGTPTAAAAAATYTISAANSGGQSTFALSLSVQSGTLLDLGHADQIYVLRFDGTHVLSVDVTGHWVLWTYATGATIASGDSVPCGSEPVVYCLVHADLVGTTLAIQTATTFELRSLVDGHVTVTIQTPGESITWWKLASDGSYLVAGSSAGLQVWSTTGQLLYSKPITDLPTYNGTVVAAPGELRAPIAVGPLNVVQTITLATGIAANSAPYQGSFLTWFADGNRFLSSVSNVVITYSSAAVQEDSTTLPAGGFVAAGNWFGEQVNGTLNIYKVGASASAAASFPVGSQAGVPMFVVGTNFAVQTSTAVSVFDLSGATPARVDQPTPVAGGSAYAATSLTQWLVGNNNGVLFDGASSVATPRYLGYGAVWGIAGSGTRFAIATASGRVLHFDAASKTLEGTIANFASKRVFLSTDGAVLATLGDTQARVYSLPGEGPISTWPMNTGDPVPTDIRLSGSGNVLGQVFGGGAQTNPVTGGGAIWTSTGATCPGLRLSSDGSHIACAANGSGQPEGYALSDNSTQIYNIGGQGATLSGLAAGWVDGGHLLVNNFKLLGGGPGVIFNGATVYDPAGNFLAISPLPWVADFQGLTADSIYSAKLNSILSVTSGQATWISGNSSRGIGAVAGSNVVFASGAQVLALSR